MWGAGWADRLKKGRHPDRALTAVKVRQVVAPGRYADGNGLYLVVDPSGAKRWLLRLVVQGKRRDIGLGSLRLVGLAEAREKALSYRKVARGGGDPLAERVRVKVVAPTFEEAAEQVHAGQRASWKNEKHAAQWINTLRTYVHPHIGARAIDQIATPDILRVLSPIWHAKPETARRVRQRMHTVFDWAQAAGHRSGENPVAGVTRGLSNQTARPEHHAALPFAEVPVFMTTLKASNEGRIVKLAFEFLILTAARTSEVLNAEWSEIVSAEALWVVPASRMKVKREHRVPLARRALDILQQVKELSDGGLFIFPGRLAGKPLSNMALLMALRRLAVPVTVHGFRSSFRDWAAEMTNIPREVAEMALAHTIKSRVEAAYRRGDMLAKRRELMDSWASHIISGSPNDGQAKA